MCLFFASFFHPLLSFNLFIIVLCHICELCIPKSIRPMPKKYFVARAENKSKMARNCGTRNIFICRATVAQTKIIVYNCCADKNYATQLLCRQKLCYATIVQTKIMPRNYCGDKNYATQLLCR